MLGWGVAVCGCGGRCLKQDLRDLRDGGFVGMGGSGGDFAGWGTLWRSSVLGWGVAVGGCGGRCLKQDLRDILGIFGMGDAHGIKETIGWKDWQDD